MNDHFAVASEVYHVVRLCAQLFGLAGLAHVVIILPHVTSSVYMDVYICNLSRFSVFNKYVYLRLAVSNDFRFFAYMRFFAFICATG